MDDIQFTIVENLLKKIIELLEENNKPFISGKHIKLKQTKIVDERSLEEQTLSFKNYSPSMITDFLLYWEEEGRWKKEKVFDVSKRLERWKRQQDKWDFEKSQKQILKKVDEKPEEKRNNLNNGFSKITF